MARQTNGDATTATVAVAKGDLIQAWQALERFVVSLHSIDSHYALPDKHARRSQRERMEMLDEIDRLLTPTLYRQLGRARVTLSQYLPDDEAETLSDALSYYRPRGPSRRRREAKRARPGRAALASQA